MVDALKLARGVIDALDEAALVIEQDFVRVANAAAQNLLGSRIEGHNVRLAIRHPRVLDLVLSKREGEVDAAGIGDPRRSFRAFVRPLDQRFVLLRLVDRSQTVSAERMRVDFVANASHELRTPLSAVIGYAETLVDADRLEPAEIARFGGTIRSEAMRMLRIVEDLMSLSRIEADRFILPSEAVDVGQVLAESIANVGPSSDCLISVEAIEPVSPVLGDRAQLVQLFDNLLSNALRYGCDKPGACVDVRIVESGDRVEVAVIDQGPGIPREHLPRLTERFYRVDDARSRESGGTGLGLAIVKHVVERHRGSLDIDSTLGVGTTVTVGLPIAR